MDRGDFLLKKANINDVARLADVSIKTVSRVLNHEPKVRKSTQERVLEAMETLKYSPNSSARRLAGNRSYLLGLLYDDRSAHYVTNLQAGVLEACSRDHYDVLIYPCRHNDPSILNKISELASSGRIDGLLLTPPISDVASVRKLVRRLEIPNVVLALAQKGDSKWTVDTNDRKVCAEMVHYLAKLGHNRIAFVLGHPDHIAVSQRFEGFKDGMRENGLELPASYCEQGNNSFDSGAECGRRLFNKKQRPTAVFCANDEMAAGVKKVAHEMGISIPGSLSIVGFDDIPLASQLYPMLTTIRQPTRDMAKLAAELLIMRLRGESPEGIKKILNSELIIRDSTGPAQVQKNY
jgi:LacI family transcriptional regulator